MCATRDYDVVIALRAYPATVFGRVAGVECCGGGLVGQGRHTQSTMIVILAMPFRFTPSY